MVSDFSSVVIMGFNLVRFEMSMNERMLVGRVGFVQVLPWHQRAKHQPGAERERDDHTA
jgi:hypothetical protein